MTAEQEAVVLASLETLALGTGSLQMQQDDAQQALEEWWQGLLGLRIRAPVVEAERRVARGHS